MRLLIQVVLTKRKFIQSQRVSIDCFYHIIRLCFLISIEKSKFSGPLNEHGIQQKHYVILTYSVKLNRVVSP